MVPKNESEQLAGKPHVYISCVISHLRSTIGGTNFAFPASLSLPRALRREKCMCIIQLLSDDEGNTHVSWGYLGVAGCYIIPTGDFIMVDSLIT